MKKIQYILMIMVAITMASCKDYLTRYPDGANISADQYNNIGASRLEGTLIGLYSMIYEDGSSSHDVFGQRSIDLWGDILSGDMAVTNKTYGWLYSDEQQMTVTARTGYIWSFYYGMIHNINTTIAAINQTCNVRDSIAKYGYPSAEECQHKYTANDTEYALYLAQALALRGYCYANLARWYTPVQGNDYFKGYTIRTYKCCPVYTELNMENPQGLSKSEEVYTQTFSDLEMAVKLFEDFGTLYYDLNDGAYIRSSKLMVDINVARGLLAYAYLNAAPYYSTIAPETAAEFNQNAFDYAKAVIDDGAFHIISNDKLLTTGFNDINDNSWMWGQKVTTETAGGLKSWFGQVDIHSYSYAWAGDTKVIDDNLWNAIPEWDLRSMWFNDGSKASKFKGCPDGKFFSAQCPTSTKDDDIDREWLSDNVFMRFESMYLIAAEASFEMNKMDDAIHYLTFLTDERINYTFPDWDTEYAAWKASLNDNNNLREAIYNNWRIEMWGEGYALQTFRRMGSWFGERVRGGSHDYNPGGRSNSSDQQYNMNIPSAEATYNPNIGTTSL